MDTMYARKIQMQPPICIITLKQTMGGVKIKIHCSFEHVWLIWSESEWKEKCFILFFTSSSFRQSHQLMDHQRASFCFHPSAPVKPCNTLHTKGQTPAYPLKGLIKHHQQTQNRHLR